MVCFHKKEGLILVIFDIIIGAFIALWLFTGMTVFCWHYSEVKEANFWEKVTGFLFMLVVGPFVLAEAIKGTTDQIRELHLWGKMARSDEDREGIPIFRRHQTDTIMKDEA